jgi:hypothetical protein
MSTTAPTAAPSARRKEAPTRNPVFAHLELEGLRAYRRGLMDEENRVSYWRRLVQARRQLLETIGERGADEPIRSKLSALQPALSETRPQNGRMAHLSTRLPDDTPPLPDLERLWSEEPAPEDRQHAARLAADLAEAEASLNQYRASVHSRLDETTAELVARYAEDPTACFVALPFGDASPTSVIASRG